jgi:hypothetical protein
MIRWAITAILLVTIAAGSTAVGWSVSPEGALEVSMQSGDPGCASDGPEMWRTPGVMLIAATSPTAYRCLEDCSKARQRCEEEGKFRPGSRENIEWSSQCQGNYSQCLSSCK